MAESEQMKKRSRVNLKLDPVTFKALHTYVAKRKGRTVQSTTAQALREFLARNGVIRLRKSKATSEGRSPLDSEGSTD